MNFREDINGLRAIAVVSVVLFHFSIPGFSGGFAGVDIFFVISGFLMTQQIVSKLDRNSFSILSFYAGRVRRIVPALLFLCAIMLGAGWYLLAPETFRALGKHSFSSLLFISNVTYWLEANYFDEAARAKWLLHTWSLSVEWQFYFIYPILLCLLNRIFSRGGTIYTLSSLLVSSFISSIWFSYYHPSAAFYLFPFRAWEMLAGGLVYFFPHSIDGFRSRSCEAIGIALIAISIFLFNETVVWPGWLALFPVVGTALIIFANRKRSFFTTTPISAFLGKTSYSIYLWHWPIVVALYYRGLSYSTVPLIVGIALSIALGWLSYMFVERSSKYINGIPSVLSDPRRIAVVATLVCVFSAYIFLANGVPKRATPDFQRLTETLAMAQIGNGGCFYSVDTDSSLKVGEGQDCRLGSKQNVSSALIFGDSYAGQYDPFWDKLGKDSNISLTSVSTNWCFPSLEKTYSHADHERAQQQCLANRRFLSENISRYPIIIFAGQWRDIISDGDFGEFEKVVKEASSKARVLVLMSAPTKFDMNPRLVFENSLFAKYKPSIDSISTKVDDPLKDANERVKVLASQYQNAVFISRDDMFSLGSHVQSVVDGAGVPYTFDGNHISVRGALAAAENYMATDEYAALKSKLQ